MWHDLCHRFPIWQGGKMVYVVFNLYAKKRHCGAVGYITGEIPSVLGSILGHVTFFLSFIMTIKCKVI